MLPLALTMGDPAGIGGEIAAKAWLRRDDAGGSGGRGAPFALLGDPAWLDGCLRAVGLENRVPVAVVERWDQVTGAFADGLPVMAVPLARPAVAGKPDAGNAAATIASIEMAVAAAASGAASGVVTLPIAKHVLQAAGFGHPGHTEFLGALAVTHWPGAACRPVMMLACPQLRVVPVTIHLSLRAALSALTEEDIVAVARITAAALRTDFGIAEPRLALCGLNPHAGEDGRMGTEDGTIIAPAIARLQAEGINARGPLPADTLFHAEARAGYDAALGMYHDQALIPIKTLDFHGGVNVTLGLPFVRTSPDHGTAFDIAGRGLAREDSLLAALRLGAEMVARRRATSAGLPGGLGT